MSTNPSSDNLLIGKGSVYFKRDDETNPHFRHLGNVETLEITTEDDVLEKRSSMEAAAPLYKSITRSRTPQLRLTMDEFNAENLALVLLGDVVSSSAQTATPVVDEEMTDNAALGGFYRTAKIGPITAVSLESDGYSLTLGTDYEITNAGLGLIRILEDSPTVTAGATITISYTPTAYTGGFTQVRGGTKNDITGSVLFIADPTSGPAQMLEVWKVSVRPDGALGLISEDFAQMAAVMKILSDKVNHASEPFYLLTQLTDGSTI